MGSLSCGTCNGCHDDKPCPKRLLIAGHYYRVLSVKEFARRRRVAMRKMNRDQEDAWRELDYVTLWCPHYKKMLPISSVPIFGRMFVEAVAR